MNKFFATALLCIGCGAANPNVVLLCDKVCSNVSEIDRNSNAEKSFILLSSKDGLDDEDIDMFHVGLSCLGYTSCAETMEASLDSAKEYFSYNVDFLYFSGHGAGNQLYISDSRLYLREITFMAKHTFLSSCFTLANLGIVEKSMSLCTESVMGYYKESYDPYDNTVALDMLSHMQEGASIPMAFYLSHKYNPKLHDRWVIYKRIDGEVVEFSERSGNTYAE